MGIEELATVVTGELGWINFMLMFIAVMLGMMGYAFYTKMKRIEDELRITKRKIEELKKRSR